MKSVHVSQKTPTNFQPNPIKEHLELTPTLYSLPHGCSYQVTEDVFGVSKVLASETFNFVIRIIVVVLYDGFFAFPKAIVEWKKEL